MAKEIMHIRGNFSRIH